MDWLKRLFGVRKPIIGMCHLRALPGDPAYDAEHGMEGVVDAARQDLRALQDGGINAVMFSNEFSRPYLTDVATVTVAAMARTIGELLSEIVVPFGVDVLWDAEASLDLAAAVGAGFAREVFSGAYAGDFGLWNTHCGETVRHQHVVGAQDVRLLYNIYPEAAAYLSDRALAEVATTTVFNALPDALCVSGPTAGAETDAALIAQVKEAVPDVPVFVNTGVRLDTVVSHLSIADGAVVGTWLKKDGITWNPVKVSRVEAFMERVETCRGN
jgi:membrane complex biogenesis BtpA family protein